jgi:beta-barrel assembly-enhancing protease
LVACLLLDMRLFARAREPEFVTPCQASRCITRELGIGAVIRLFAGNLGANAEQIVSLSYTRSNEAPEFSAEFLESHPASSARAANFAASSDTKAHYQPASNRKQWDALFDICTKRSFVVNIRHAPARVKCP